MKFLRLRLPEILIAIVAITMAVLVVKHVPHVNGPAYWQWPWRNLDPAWYRAAALASVPAFLGQFLWIRKRLLVPAILLACVSCLALQLTGAAFQSSDRSFRHIVRAVMNRDASGFLFIADVYARSGVSTTAMLGRYVDDMPHFPGHVQTKPAGAVVLMRMLRSAAGPNAPLAAGLLFAILAAVTPIAAFAMMRALDFSKEAALCAATCVALTPSFVLFLPELDQCYALITAGLVILWRRSIVRASWAYAIAFGTLFTLALSFTFSFLVLGIFLLGMLTRTAIKVCAVAGFTVIFWNVIFWLTLHYNVIAVFRRAIHLQSLMAATLRRPYPQTIGFDLYDFVLGCGWVVVPLCVLWAISEAREKYAWLAILQIVAIAILGVLQTETARVWIFLVPLMMIPAGAVLARRGVVAQQLTYAALVLATATLLANMTFIAA